MKPADPWQQFRLSTRARIGLGRAGDALPTREVLDFTFSHARARDAVHGAVDFENMAAALAPLPVLIVDSRAEDRLTYLRRPDFGRCLAPESRLSLPRGDWDAVFVVADGLSASAVSAHAVPMLRAMLARLPDFRVAPIVLARQGRVAIGDEIAEALGAKLCALLVGERPGLSVQDSLGIYLTYEARVGRRDAERNCISNIHAHGLSIGAAADKLAWLMREAVRRRLTGVGLKEDFAPVVAGPSEVAGLL